MRFLAFFLMAGLVYLTTGAVTAQNPSERLHRLFDEEWEWTLRENPLLASQLGDKRYNGRWPDESLEALQQRHAHRQDVLKQLAGFDPSSLPGGDRLNLALFRREYEVEVESFPYRWYLLPLSHSEGIQIANEVADAIQFSSARDYEDWLSRLNTFPLYMEQTMGLLREGIRTGRAHPRVIMERLPDQIRAQILDDPADSLFFKPFVEFAATLTDAEQERFRSEAAEAIETRVVPAYQALLTFFTDEYLPACPAAVGIWQLPEGEELYAFRARVFTTTDLTPAQIHEIGRNEVRRIRAEMDRIIEAVGFKGSFEDFLEFLRTDPRFYFTDPQELLREYRDISKQIDPTLVRLFGRLPRIPYGIEPIPDNIAPDTTTAYYRQPAADGSRAGTYFVNLYRPEVRPRYEMEALSIHEAVPGHHLQIALAMELGDLPKFRRYGGYTAFTEGWGLYSESLGSELGFYRDPYSKFGQLTYEMWRAVRLVVDTGMHSMKWTRQQAIDFFKAHAAKSEYDIVNEIDRYIAWPGQALAYKIGELKIKELRARAERQLGDRFDIRAFHDTVLGAGAVPLDVLEQRVVAWIEGQGAD